MNRKTIIYTTLLLLILGLYLAAEFLLPDKTDWKESFSSNDKIPYGCYVIYKMLPQMFPGQKIKNNNLSLFELLEKNEMNSANNLVIITYSFNPDNNDLDALLNFLQRGNTALISAVKFGEIFSDTLKLQSFEYNPFGSSINGVPLQLFPKNVNKCGGYDFKHRFPASWFGRADTSKSIVLGCDTSENLNFFSMQFGKGKLYMHSQPHVFTNDNILFDNKEYASAVLSFLPLQPVIWDEYYKPDRVASGSPIRYILQSPALKTAYYLLLCSILIYIFAEGRRRQRIIPVIQPLTNSSLAFTRTIARLYYFRRNHSDLVQKKFNHFREFLFEKYFLRTQDMNEEWIRKASVKCAIGEEIFRNIANLYLNLNNNVQVSKQELFSFSNAIEDFYKKAKNN
jgi:hypothetical protein